VSAFFEEVNVPCDVPRNGRVLTVEKCKTSILQVDVGFCDMLHRSERYFCYLDRRPRMRDSQAKGPSVGNRK